MIKKTLMFSNPAHLSLRDRQLCISLKTSGEERSIALEDIGVILIEDHRITLTHALISGALAAGIALVTCDERHMPQGMLMPFEANNLHSARLRIQVGTPPEVKRELWKQTVKAKIRNQAALLDRLGIAVAPMIHWIHLVQPGDPENLEGRAAAWYWPRLFPHGPDDDTFIRDPMGGAPNHLLNYVYAILRAMTARALVCAGLLPALGLHHRNQYNAFCLADDIMEPYRPFGDALVTMILAESVDQEPELTKETKARLLNIAVADVGMGKHTSPLMVALSSTASSLVKCLSGERKTLDYPHFPGHAAF